MKKYLLGALMVCGALWAEANESGADAKLQYAGWYAGLGIDYQYNRNNVSLNDNLGYVGAVALAPFVESDAHDFCLNYKGKDNIGGTFNLGYGGFVDSKCYLGADLTVDISEDRKTSVTIDQERTGLRYDTTTVKNTGTVPTLAARLGAYVFNTLVYARFGAAFVKSEVTVDMLRYRFESKEFTPVLGLGFEKSFSKHCSLKLEGDYRFSSRKKVSNVKALHIADAYLASVESRVRGYVVRVVGVYHF